MDRGKASAPAAGSGRSGKYFARTALWDWHDEARIDILERDGRVRATLDPWQTAVFHGADANHTIDEFLADLRRPYGGHAAIPDDFDETVSKCLTGLVEDLRIVELCDRPKDLPYYFDLPKRAQDPARALEAMAQDGLAAGD
jgi:hypothetical protein